MSETDTSAGGVEPTGALPRAVFDETREFVDLDLSGLVFRQAEDVSAFFDALDRRLRETGRPWFFLVRDDGLRIEPAAWTRWADRTDRTRRSHGLGTARYPDPDGFGARIQDPTRFATRAAALAAIDGMVAEEHARGFRSRLRKRADRIDPEARRRLTLHPALDVAEIDLNGVAFDSPESVARFFDGVDRLLGRTLQRWFLLIEAENCRIAPNALAAFARRGRAISVDHGLLAVRVMGRMAEADHDPLVCVDRESALAELRRRRARAGLRSA
jgi:hypothetical protein